MQHTVPPTIGRILIYCSRGKVVSLPEYLNSHCPIGFTETDIRIQQQIEKSSSLWHRCRLTIRNLTIFFLRKWLHIVCSIALDKINAAQFELVSILMPTSSETGERSSSYEHEHDSVQIYIQLIAKTPTCSDQLYHTCLLDLSFSLGVNINRWGFLPRVQQT